MQPNTRNRPLFLEDWLRSHAATSIAAPPPAISARSILHAWAELRDPSLPSSDPHRLVVALRILDAARSSLHIAHPQAKLLLSLLSPDSRLPSDSTPLILRLLYCWLRKTPFSSPPLLKSVAAAFSQLFASPPQRPALAVLVLGALVANPALDVSCKGEALDLLCRRLETDSFDEEMVAEVLAGVGYALSHSLGAYFSRIFSLMLRIWNGFSPRTSVDRGLMILHLLEWLVTGFVNLRSFGKVEAICGELSAVKFEVSNYAPFAVAMASCGVLRALRLVPSTINAIMSPHVRSSVEDSVTSVARYALSNSIDPLEGSPLVQCISIGLAKAGLVSFSAPLLIALSRALLKEIFPLGKFCRMTLEIQKGVSAEFVIDKVKGHLESVIFKEAGAITNVFCNQYASADEEHKVLIENCMWEYSLEFYSNLRDAALVARVKNDQLLGYLEKVAEAAFLMIVVFAAEVAKQKLNPKSSSGAQPEVSVQILIAFSFIEYMRRVRLPEYTSAIRRSILTMQENAALCISFVESMPQYTELTDKQGLFTLVGSRYIWLDDEVQTARMLFFLRVIPTFINFVPASLFGKLIAPTMFLYLQHPNEKVARASHSVFVALMSSVKASDKDERVDLKEKLVFYYIKRSLEAYPGSTPFDGLASGVATLVRHLPTGSPAIFYCINCLTKKALTLCNEAISEDMDMWRTWDGSSETCKQVLDMIMRLIYLVDVQVLPYLLKQLAELVLQLPQDAKKVILGELYIQVAESDDVTRKTALVSWLHSLSYLCNISPSVESMNGSRRQFLHSML